MAQSEFREKISAKDLCKVLGFTDRSLRRLANQGVVKKLEHGKYDLAESVQGYLEFKVNSEIEKVKTPESRDQVDSERARKLKLENDTRENKLVEIDAAQGVLDFVLGNMRTALAGVPARVSGDVATRRAVENAINEVLDDLSRGYDKAGAALAEGGDPLEAVDTAAT